MKVYKIHQAKNQLSKLIRQALAGEDVVIANRNKPLVRLQIVDRSRESLLGDMKGRIQISEDFDSPVPAFKKYE